MISLICPEFIFVKDTPEEKREMDRILHSVLPPGVYVSNVARLEEVSQSSRLNINEVNQINRIVIKRDNMREKILLKYGNISYSSIKKIALLVNIRARLDNYKVCTFRYKRIDCMTCINFPYSEDSFYHYNLISLVKKVVENL